MFSCDSFYIYYTIFCFQVPSTKVFENSISFETTETNEEQLRESIDRVNIKTPHVVGSSTQPVEGVERVELVAGDKSTTEASKEEGMEKVTLKTRKQKGSENKKTATQCRNKKTGDSKNCLTIIFFAVKDIYLNFLKQIVFYYRKCALRIYDSL